MALAVDTRSTDPQMQKSSATFGAMGPYYVLSEAQIQRYNEDGYLHIPGLLTEKELAQLEPTYNRFMENKVPGVGKDLSDLTFEEGKAVDSFTTVSVLLPSKYDPSLLGNLFQLRSAHITQQLFGDGMALDLDRFIAKKPNQPGAIFHWHQDAKYCNAHGNLIQVEDNRTATLSLAMDATTPQNGCIKYVVGSHKPSELRPHKAVDPSLKTPILVTHTEVDETKERVALVPIARGDATIHGERTVHKSDGNHTDGWRRSYILQFRAQSAIETFRKAGLSRSLNDPNHAPARMEH